MTARGWRAWLVPAMAALLAACSFLGPAEPAMTSALIDQMPQRVPKRARGAATLLVQRPEARPAYDTQQMAYSLRPHHLAYYRQHQWGETPPQMLAPLLVRTLEATGAFRAIATPPFTGTAQVTVDTELLELLQDYGAEPPVLRLALRVRVSDASARPLATREFSTTEPLAARSPVAGVEAANRAMARLLEEVAGFVLEQAR
jgi:cholesterol transport system auxiliary component